MHTIRKHDSKISYAYNLLYTVNAITHWSPMNSTGIRCDATACIWYLTICTLINFVISYFARYCPSQSIIFFQQKDRDAIYIAVNCLHITWRRLQHLL